MTLGSQMVWLLVLGIPVACISWTVTHEEVLAEVREWCVRRSKRGRTLLARKFFYLFTCEYCFSHYVAGAVTWMSGFHLLLPGWRGAIIAWVTLVWIANLHMSLFVRLRLEIKRERLEIETGQDD